MSITRANMLESREEYLRDANNRGSWENEAETIKIAVLMANNNGFTKYQSLATNYEELRFNLIFSYLTRLFVDSSVTSMIEEETGKMSIIVDWGDAVTSTSTVTENSAQIVEEPIVEASIE